MPSSALRPFLLPRALRLAAALCLMLSTANCFAKDQVPDWVRAAASQKTPDLPKETDAVFLLEDTAYSVAPDGSRVDHVRKVVRILRPQGRKYGSLFASFRAGSKLRYLHIWSIGADGREYAVKDNELTEVGTGEGFELYSDGRARGAHAPAMDVGAVAAIEYERQERPFENDLVWIPGEDVPVVRETLSLNLPPGFTFTSAWKGRAKAQAVDLEHGRTLWEVSNQASLHNVEKIPLAPDELSAAARLDIFYQGPNAGGPYGSLTGDWKGIGEWYGRLAKDRNQPDPAIAAKAQELVQGKAGFRERAETLSNFVQSNIRYVAIEIGIGGEQPHAASETFRARYGDCKDKATLLSAMLSAVGLRSTWVMVDTRRGVMNREAPSLIGNHMISAIELPAGYKPEGMYSIVKANSGKRYLIFDPTSEKTPFGSLESELQGSDALLIDGADSQAIKLPVLAPEQNTLQRKASFQLAADGTLSGTVEQQQSGDNARAYRYLFAEGTGKDQQHTLDDAMSQDMLTFALSDVRIQHLQDLGSALTLSYSVKANHFAQEMGPLLSVRPRVLGREAFAVDTRKRDLPIDLHATKQVHDEFSITLPAGFQVDEVPRAIDLDLGFAAYKSETKVQDNALHYSRTYTVREISLPAERYPEVQKLARTIAGDEESSAVLKRTK